MCRLLGILAADPMPFVACLGSPAPRAVEWRVAVHDARGAWAVQERAAGALHGSALVAQVGERAGADVTIVNTAPLRSGRWIFAHNGSVEDVGLLRSRTSPARQRECVADTDSELLFAFLLTRLDQRGCTDERANDTTDATIATAACELARAGALRFMLTDGATLYAHRLGLPLYFVERAASPGVPAAHLFASEPVTAEAWTLLSDRTLLRCRRGERLETRYLAGWDPRSIPSSGAELPFTD